MLPIALTSCDADDSSSVIAVCLPTGYGSGQLSLGSDMILKINWSVITLMIELPSSYSIFLF